MLVHRESISQSSEKVPKEADDEKVKTALTCTNNSHKIWTGVLLEKF